MIQFALIGLMSVWLSSAEASVLSILAAALPERTFVKMPANASLNALTIDNSLFYYTDSGVWDPVNRKVAIVAGPGTCCANPAVYKRLTYDEVTDTWSIVNTPFSGSGHAYDGNTADPKTGHHYFSWWNNTQVRRWNGAVWQMLPAHPLNVDCCNAIAWFPDLNGNQGGLVFAGGAGKVAWYNGTAWAIVNGGGSWGDYEVSAEYNPVKKVVWLGMGNGGDRIQYLLDAQLRMTRMKDAPVGLKVNNAVKSCDPVSGNFIVYNMGSGGWWEFDPAADAWNQITNMKSKPSLGTESLFQVPIPEYGIILYFKHSGREVYLYRHTQGPGAEAEIKGAAAQLRQGLLTAPNPFRSSVAIIPPSGVTGVLKIYNLRGAQVAAMVQPGASGIFHWSPSDQPAGVYLARLEGRGGTAAVRHIVYQR